MCNRHYEVIFINTSCMIRKGKTRKLVAEGIRTIGMFIIKRKKVKTNAI